MTWSCLGCLKVKYYLTTGTLQSGRCNAGGLKTSYCRNLFFWVFEIILICWYRIRWGSVTRINFSWSGAEFPKHCVKELIMKLHKLIFCCLMYRSNRSFNMPPPLGNPPGNLTFLKIFVQIPLYPGQKKKIFINITKTEKNY